MKPPAPVTATARSASVAISRTDQLGEQILDRPRHRLGPVAGVIALRGRLSEPSARLVVAEQPQDGAGQRDGVVRWYDEPGLLVLDHLRDPAYGGDDRRL